jgi:glucose/arabinose dehydrogenase
MKERRMASKGWSLITAVLVTIGSLVGMSCSDMPQRGEDAIGTVESAVVPTGFVDDLIASGIPNPTAMAFAPDGRLFVAQQNGSLRVISNANPPVLLSTPFLSVPVSSSGERG